MFLLNQKKWSRNKINSNTKPFDSQLKKIDFNGDFETKYFFLKKEQKSKQIKTFSTKHSIFKEKKKRNYKIKSMH